MIDFKTLNSESLDESVKAFLTENNFSGNETAALVGLSIGDKFTLKGLQKVQTEDNPDGKFVISESLTMYPLVGVTDTDILVGAKHFAKCIGLSEYEDKPKFTRKVEDVTRFMLWLIAKQFTFEVLNIQEEQKDGYVKKTITLRIVQ
jgi:hypothetical protein